MQFTSFSGSAGEYIYMANGNIIKSGASVYISVCKRSDSKLYMFSLCLGECVCVYSSFCTLRLFGKKFSIWFLSMSVCRTVARQLLFSLMLCTRVGSISHKPHKKFICFAPVSRYLQTVNAIQIMAIIALIPSCFRYSLFATAQVHCSKRFCWCFHKQVDDLPWEFGLTNKQKKSRSLFLFLRRIACT